MRKTWVALMVLVTPVLLMAQTDTTVVVDPLSQIAVLLRFNIVDLMLLGGVVATLTELIKKITQADNPLPVVSGWKILFVAIPLSFLLGWYCYGSDGTLTAVVASIMIFGIGSGGWQLVKNGSKKAGEGFATAMSKMDGK